MDGSGWAAAPSSLTLRGSRVIVATKPALLRPPATGQVLCPGRHRSFRSLLTATLSALPCLAPVCRNQGPGEIRTHSSRSIHDTSLYEVPTRCQACARHWGRGHKGDTSDFCPAEPDAGQKSLVWKENSRPSSIPLPKPFCRQPTLGGGPDLNPGDSHGDGAVRLPGGAKKVL